ncbi:hypothetical protein V8G54_037598, partial [Vigna mungo]
KGSPYPRSYYRCSSSKGCLVRKQVERNHLDPVIFLVTYTAEHNHPKPNNIAFIPIPQNTTSNITNSSKNSNNIKNYTTYHKIKFIFSTSHILNTIKEKYITLHTFNNDISNSSSTLHRQSLHHSQNRELTSTAATTPTCISPPRTTKAPSSNSP